MRGRSRITGVGLLAMTALCAASSTAGAQTNQWSVQSNGGFVSLDLLNMLQFARGGSEGDASNSPVAEASGTGACLSTASSTNPIILMAGMGLAGLLLIGRRRIASLARSFNPTNRRRGGP